MNSTSEKTEQTVNHTKKPAVIEVCAGSYEDCLAAEKGGAKRVELNCGLAVGGLTPTISTLKKVKQDTDLKVICMVRPRAGGFCYTKPETEIMFDEARDLLEHGADGIAFGFLNEDGTINTELTGKMIDLIHEYDASEAVFHRAIDVTPNLLESVQILKDLKADRILTSGGQAKAIDGLEMIEKMQALAGDEIEILPGSGVNAGNASEILNKTGTFQLHSSCKDYRKDPTTTGNEVSYAYLSGKHESDYDIVSEKLVSRLVQSV